MSVVGPGLVVDDESHIREAVADLLREEGFPVVEADDGAAALDLLRSGLRPSLILLDLTMPGMDGRAFRIEQSKMEDLSGIATAVMTGSLVDVGAVGRELGGLTVLAKPVDYDDLLALATRHCSRAS
jgi:CheY-like chemotaxis protein